MKNTTAHYFGDELDNYLTKKNSYVKQLHSPHDFSPGSICLTIIDKITENCIKVGEYYFELVLVVKNISNSLSLVLPLTNYGIFNTVTIIIGDMRGVKLFGIMNKLKLVSTDMIARKYFEIKNPH